MLAVAKLALVCELSNVFEPRSDPLRLQVPDADLPDARTIDHRAGVYSFHLSRKVMQASVASSMRPDTRMSNKFTGADVCRGNQRVDQTRLADTALTDEDRSFPLQGIPELAKTITVARLIGSASGHDGNTKRRGRIVPQLVQQRLRFRQIELIHHYYYIVDCVSVSGY